MQLTRFFLWKARPAANAACRPAQSQKLRPGVRAPTKQPVRGATLCRWHAFLVGGATRGEYSLPARSKPEASPRGRASHESSRCVASPYAAARVFCGRRDPRRMQLAGPLKPKASPRGRGSHEAARAWRHFMQVARFSCGRRDPRRMQLASPLKARSFAPRSGLPRSSPCVASLHAGDTLFLWEARPAANAACRPAQSQKLPPRTGLLRKLPVRGAVMCSLGYSTSMSRSCRQSRACRSVSSGHRFSGRLTSTLRAPAALAHSRSKR